MTVHCLRRLSELAARPELLVRLDRPARLAPVLAVAVPLTVARAAATLVLMVACPLGAESQRVVARLLRLVVAVLVVGPVIPNPLGQPLGPRQREKADANELIQVLTPVAQQARSTPAELEVVGPPQLARASVKQRPALEEALPKRPLATPQFRPRGPSLLRQAPLGEGPRVLVIERLELQEAKLEPATRQRVVAAPDAMVEVVAGVRRNPGQVAEQKVTEPLAHVLAIAAPERLLRLLVAWLARLAVIVRLRLEREALFQGLARSALAHSRVVVGLGYVMAAPAEVQPGQVAVRTILPMRPLLAVVIESQEGGTG